MITSLPIEIIDGFALYLDERDLIALNKSCRYLNSCKFSSRWKQIFYEKYNHPETPFNGLDMKKIIIIEHTIKLNVKKMGELQKINDGLPLDTAFNLFVTASNIAVVVSPIWALPVQILMFMSIPQYIIAQYNRF